MSEASGVDEGSGDVVGLFVFEGVVGGAYRFGWVDCCRVSRSRPVWMRLRVV